MKRTENVPQPSRLLRGPAPMIKVDTPAANTPQNVATQPSGLSIGAYASNRHPDHSPRSNLSSPGTRELSPSIENIPLLSMEPKPSPESISTPASGKNCKAQEPPHLLGVPGPRSRASSLGGAPSIPSPGENTLSSTAATSVNEGSRREPGDTVGLYGLRDDGGLLKANPGDEESFHVEDNPFAFSPGQLSKLLNPKSLAAFRALGGLHGIASGLRTDTSSGLSVDESTLDGTVKFDEATVCTTFASSNNLVSQSVTSTIYQADAERYNSRSGILTRAVTNDSETSHSSNRT